MNYNLGDKVYYPSDAAPFVVVGIRKDSIEIEGDFSGGTHNVCQRSWVPISDVKPFDYSKTKVYESGRQSLATSPPTGQWLCKKCNGYGVVNEPGKPEKHDCAYCNGTGKMDVDTIVYDIIGQLSFNGFLSDRITVEEAKEILYRFAHQFPTGQEAIEFAEWIGNNNYKRVVNGTWGKSFENENFTSEQLYQLFRSSNKK